MKTIEGGLHDPDIWEKYAVTMNFVGRLSGSTPANKETLPSWIESLAPSVRPPSASKSIAEITEEVANRLPNMTDEMNKAEKRSTIVFQQVKNTLVVPAYSLRAHIKDCTSQVQNQLIGRIKGERNFTTRVKNGLYVGGGFYDDNGAEVLQIKRSGKPLATWDGFQEKTVRANTPQGPISALKKFAFILRPTIDFQVFLLGESVKIDDLLLILKYGAVHGYGGERSHQDGQYTFSITPMKGGKNDRKEKLVAA